MLYPKKPAGAGGGRAALLLRVPVPLRRRAPDPRRAGFTLVELAVVVAVIAVVLSLVLAAVQRTRAAARRAACQNNLRQLGVANHDYLALHGHFPPTRTVTQWPPHPQLLPHLGEAPLFARLDLTRGRDEWEIGEHGGAADLPVPAVYRCPADPVAARPGMSQTNYVWSGGAWLGELGGAGGAGPTAPGFNSGYWIDGSGGPLRPGQITDGLSQTAAYTETLPGLGWGPGEDPRRVVYENPVLPDASDAEFVRVCLSLPGGPTGRIDPAALNRSHVRHNWLRARSLDFTLPPNTRSCRRAVDDPYRQVMKIGSATAEHPGGVNVLLADGAVRFVGDGIVRAVWSALGTRDAGDGPGGAGGIGDAF